MPSNKSAAARKFKYQNSHRSPRFFSKAQVSRKQNSSPLSEVSTQLSISTQQFYKIFLMFLLSQKALGEAVYFHIFFRIVPFDYVLIGRDPPDTLRKLLKASLDCGSKVLNISSHGKIPYDAQPIFMDSEFRNGVYPGINNPGAINMTENLVCIESIFNAFEKERDLESQQELWWLLYGLIALDLCCWKFRPEGFPGIIIPAYNFLYRNIINTLYTNLARCFRGERIADFPLDLRAFNDDEPPQRNYGSISI